MVRTATKSPSRARSAARHGLAAALFLAGCSIAPLAADPLVVRVADAIGAPGQQTAIVLRTYASRPIRRGRLTLVAGSGLTALAPAGSSPFSSADSVLVFSGENDGEVDSLSFNDATGVFITEFDSASFTINENDGVFAVIFATVGAGSSPGACWALNLSDLAANTFLTDPDDDEHTLEIRDGEFCVRAADAPLEVEVDGGKVHPGSAAVVEISTAEPFPVESGTILVTYDPSHFHGTPTLLSDLRHGDGSPVLSFPAPGQAQIDISSANDDFNTVPGDILHLVFSTRAEVPLGTISPLTVETASSFLEGPGSAVLDVDFFAEGIEFASDPGIYSDAFETGDAWVWSRVTP